MSNVDFLESLIENDSIQFTNEKLNWKEAIIKTFQPLILNWCVTNKYPQNVIQSTIKNGPYYIITEKVAMPHSRPEDGALKNSFSLLITKNSVNLDNNLINIFIGFAATDTKNHLEKALPQIVAIFEDPKIVNSLIECSTKEEVIKIIKTIDYLKYVKGDD